MGSKIRKNEAKDNLDEKIKIFIKNEVISALKRGTKASEKEAEKLIDDFVKNLD